MPETSNSNRWVNSWAYRKARNTVSALLNSPKKLLALVEKATQKSERQRHGALAKTLESVKVMVRLITAYVSGEYRAVSTENLLMIIAALVYFVMPLDALPDFIVVLGLTDDAAILAWTWRRVKDEVERFIAWELAQPEAELEQPKPALDASDHNTDG